MADEDSVLFDLEDEPYDVVEATKLKPIPMSEEMASALGLDGHEGFEGLGQEHVVRTGKGPGIKADPSFAGFGRPGDFDDGESYDVFGAMSLKPMPEDVIGTAVDTMVSGAELFGQPEDGPSREAPEDVPGREDVEEPSKGPSLR